MYTVKRFRKEQIGLRGEFLYLCDAAQNDKFESSDIMRRSNIELPFSTWRFIFERCEFWKGRSALWMIYDEDMVPVGLSGVYEHSIHKAVIGSRTWIVPEHRTKSLMGDNVFPLQEEFCRENDYSCMMMTFNLNNQWLPNMILRAASEKALQFGKANSEFYKGWQEAPPRVIREVFQRVLWKSLDGGTLDEPA